jgi:putative lipoic acid-binding regulatory protein
LSEVEKPRIEPPPGLVYPCEFPLKLFIKPDIATEARLIELARSQLGSDAKLETSRRSSSGGKYLSLTLNFVAKDREHLQRVIDTVRVDPGVVLAL